MARGARSVDELQFNFNDLEDELIPMSINFIGPRFEAPWAESIRDFCKSPEIGGLSFIWDDVKSLPDAEFGHCPGCQCFPKDGVQH